MSDTHHDGIIDFLRQYELEGKVRATARHHDCAGKPYRPSTGTEAAWFQDQWCGYCERDAAFRDNPDSGDGCRIVADTFVYEISDPKYPKEWVFDRDGRPCCKAFTTDPKCPVRCDKTIDMFDTAKAQSTETTER